MHRCYARSSVKHRYPRGVSFWRIHEYARQKGEARVILVPFNLAPNPSHFLFFSRRTYACKRGLSEQEGATGRSAPFSFVNEDRALAAVALSAPASPAINPPLSRACARRSGRCVGAHWILCVLLADRRAHTHAHTHKRTRAATILLAHHISSEHEKVERDWEEANKREGVEEDCISEAEAKWVHSGYDNYPIFHCYSRID